MRLELNVASFIPFGALVCSYVRLELQYRQMTIWRPFENFIYLTGTFRVLLVCIIPPPWKRKNLDTLVSKNKAMPRDADIEIPARQELAKPLPAPSCDLDENYHEARPTGYGNCVASLHPKSRVSTSEAKGLTARNGGRFFLDMKMGRSDFLRLTCLTKDCVGSMVFILSIRIRFQIHGRPGAHSPYYWWRLNAAQDPHRNSPS